MQKRISYRDFQSVKNVAKALAPKVAEANSIMNKLNTLAEEYNICIQNINLLEAGVVKTIGFHVADLVKKVVEPTGKVNEKGKPLTVTRYIPTDIVSYDEKNKQYVITVPDTDPYEPNPDGGIEGTNVTEPQATEEVLSTNEAPSPELISTEEPVTEPAPKEEVLMEEKPVQEETVPDTETVAESEEAEEPQTEEEIDKAFDDFMSSIQ